MIIPTQQLESRIFGLGETPREGKDIYVTPLLDDKQVSNSAIDIRLGRHFIVSRRTRFACLDALDPDMEERIGGYQEEIFADFGENIVLHANSAILGVTLEYIKLPADVYCEVMTRSSWGRLDLTIATAIAIHPGYAGCPTLELENKGLVPVRLYVGSRVGQLVFHKVDGEDSCAYREGKYPWATKPQFSQVYKERDELETFRRIGARKKRGSRMR